mmetsp:Transcript_11010/g.12107  ORF Transcript_11010/g.12107 Transcript_11010/m.12107 type:complete len:99 (-) Transcript_11010:7-303(-)
MGGKQFSSIEKPLLTDDHKKNIKIGSRRTSLFPVAFLADEKWFNRTSRRRTIKVTIPKASGLEDDMEIPTYNCPKIRSRLYLMKIMSHNMAFNFIFLK